MSAKNSRDYPKFIFQDPFAAAGGFGQANFSLEQLDPLKK